MIQIYHSNLVYDYTGRLREVFKMLGAKQGNRIQHSESQLSQFHQWLSRYKDGTMIRTEIKVFRPKRSANQIKAHFGLVVKMIRERMNELGWDICGVLPNKEMIHEILKKCCGGVGEDGEVLGLSEMNTEQCSKFFENCRAWAAKELSLNIPDPDPNWKEKT